MSRKARTGHARFYITGVYIRAASSYDDRMGAWDKAGEGATLPYATSHRDEWDETDLEFVAAFRDDPDTTDIDLALALGRSLYAVQSIKSVLDERLRRRVSRRLTEERRNRGFDFVTTFPPGWFD